MRLIADSGSTKTDWCAITPDNQEHRLTTIGLNPNYIEEELIFKTIEALPWKSHEIKEIFFYGSGCGVRRSVQIFEDAFLYKYPHAASHIQGDLLGAAVACLGDQPGVIGILGTGSNTGVYDGQRLVANHPSLGAMLGDYGSGLDIGKQIIRDYFYGQMPTELAKEIELSWENYITKVYHQDGANTFVASYASIVFQHVAHPYVKALIGKVFDRFIASDILTYPDASKYRVHLVGSIAFLFQDILEASLNKHGLQLGNVLQKPIDQLVKYHYFG